MDNTQEVRKIISSIVDHTNRQNIHDLIDNLDDNSLREILKNMFESACGLERIK